MSENICHNKPLKPKYVEPNYHIINGGVESCCAASLQFRIDGLV